ncbi:hypothetical protein [Nitrospira sp. Kam-Ns4a]
MRETQKLEAIGRLLGGSAHEFDNLLQVLNGYCQLLIERLPPNGPSRRKAEAIKEGGIRAAAPQASSWSSAVGRGRSARKDSDAAGSQH